MNPILLAWLVAAVSVATCWVSYRLLARACAHQPPPDQEFP